ncbi:MAG: hypothetical protein Fur0028_10710 [Bacteroidales bacterium]
MFACSGSKQENNQAAMNETSDTTNFTNIKTAKMYSTLSDGTVKETAVNATIQFSDKVFNVSFENDSSWNFEVKEKTQKPEGTTFTLQDKKYKEIFISSGSLPMITFTTHTETGNITLM